MAMASLNFQAVVTVANRVSLEVKQLPTSQPVGKEGLVGRHLRHLICIRRIEDYWLSTHRYCGMAWLVELWLTG